MSEDQDVNLVQEVRNELEEIDASDLSEHSARFEALHEKLQALSRYADLPQSARDRSCLLALRKMVPNWRRRRSLSPTAPR